MADNYTPQQRAQLFAMQTRQNLQMMARQATTTIPSTLQFTLPKARLLSGLYISAKFYLDSTETAQATANYNKGFRKISLDLNNGFMPYSLSGAEMELYNKVDINAHQLTAWNVKSDTENKLVTVNYFMPVTTSPRDPIGLILLQSDSTVVTLNLDLGTASEMGLAKDITKVEVKVMAETFSIPANANAYPDLSVLKLVNGRVDSLPTAGQQIIKLSTGTIYRKIMLKLEDSNGTPFTPADITSNIELVFNQADVNYSIDPEMLRYVNEKELGEELPAGVFMFDFSSGGAFPNMGGTRDFIDSANLTEFWVRFNTGKVGKCTIVTETLARLS